MKAPKLFFLLPTLILAGCTAQDDLVPSDPSGEVTFNINLESNQGSRAGRADDGRAETADEPTYLGDDNINILYYQAFDVTDKDNVTTVFKTIQSIAIGKNASTSTATTDTNTGTTASVSSSNGYQVTLNLNLPTSRSYDVVFWAQNDFSSENSNDENFKDNNPFTLNWINTTNSKSGNFKPTVDVDYTKITSNNNNYVSAFYATTGAINSATTNNVSVTLKRAVAQINVGTDYDGFSTLDKSIRPIYSGVTFSKLPNKLYVLSGDTEVSDNKVTFGLSKNIASQYREKVDEQGEAALANIKSKYMLTTTIKNDANTGDNQASGTTNTDYAWVSMCYVLAPSTSYSIASATFNFAAQSSESESKKPNDYTYQINVPNIPITQNYRTNIISSLTGKVKAIVTTNFAWTGNQNNILRLSARQFQALTDGLKSVTELNYDNYDIIINLNDSTIVAPTQRDEYGNSNGAAVTIKARSITIQNGTINNSCIHFSTDGETYIKNIKFTGDTNHNSPIVIGDGTYYDTNNSDYAPTIRLEGLDFSGLKNDVQYNILVDGAVNTPTYKTPLTDGTTSLTVIGCTFTNFYQAGLYISGLGSNAIAEISNTTFYNIPNTVYGGLLDNDNFTKSDDAFTLVYPTGIKVANTSGSTGASIGISNVNFSYNGSTQVYPYTTGLVGLNGQTMQSTKSDNKDKDCRWPLSSWTFSFKNIYYGTTTDNLITELNPGQSNSLLGLPTGYEKSWFPAYTAATENSSASYHIYVGDTSGEQKAKKIDFTAYPTNYFK